MIKDKTEDCERKIMKIVKGKKLAKEFEYMREMAELRALSKLSLERPLLDLEFKRFKFLGKKYGLSN